MPRKSDKVRPELQHYQLDGALLGKSLARRRKHLKLSMQELSDRAGVSATTILKLEHGEITVQLDKFLQIMDQLGLPLDSVIGYGGESQDQLLDPLAKKVAEMLGDEKLEEAVLLLVREMVDRKSRK